MVKYIEKDLSKRKIVKKNELKRLMYKYIIKNLNINQEIRYKFLYKLNKLNLNTVKHRCTNRCMITGRNRSVFRLFRVSRIKFRELSCQSLLPGVTKASW